MNPTGSDMFVTRDQCSVSHSDHEEEMYWRSVSYKFITTRSGFHVLIHVQCRIGAASSNVITKSRETYSFVSPSTAVLVSKIDKPTSVCTIACSGPDFSLLPSLDLYRSCLFFRKREFSDQLRRNLGSVMSTALSSTLGKVQASQGWKLC